MSDQTPIRYTTRSEERSVITFAPERVWFPTVHRIVDLLDRAMEKRGKASAETLIYADRKGHSLRNAGTRWPNRQERIAEVRAFMETHPDVRPSQIGKQFKMDPNTVRAIRKDMGLPRFPNGKKLAARFSELLEKNPELTNQQAADMLQSKRKYIGRLRRAMEASRTAKRLIS